MKQIKTVTYNVDFSENFDKEVNELLLEGWELKRRDVVHAGSALLYAELEWESHPDLVERYKGGDRK